MRFAFLLAIPLLAHDLYLMPKNGTVAFHNGDDFPTPDRAPKPENILNPTLHFGTQKLPLQNLRVDGKVLRAEYTLPGAGPAMLSAHTRPSFIELEASKFESYLAHEGLTYVLQYRASHGQAANTGRERYSKYVKSLLTPGAFQQVVGLPIEIVALCEPTLGAALPIQVLFRGKPAADLQIEMAWVPANGEAVRKTAGRTDKHGKLSIPIEAKGTWKLHSVLMERCQDPAVADWESFWTSLTFEIQ